MNNGAWEFAKAVALATGNWHRFVRNNCQSIIQHDECVSLSGMFNNVYYCYEVFRNYFSRFLTAWLCGWNHFYLSHELVLKGNKLFDWYPILFPLMCALFQCNFKTYFIEYNSSLIFKAKILHLINCQALSWLNLEPRLII